MRPGHTTSRRRWNIGLAVGILVSWLAPAADLLQVYRQAQASDPTFEAARYTLDATREKVPQARAGLLPTVNLNGNANRTWADTSYTNVPTVNRNVDAWTWTLQLTQPVIRLQNLYAYNESQSLVEAAEAEYANAEQDLILRVAQAYFDIRTAWSDRGKGRLWGWSTRSKARSLNPPPTAIRAPRVGRCSMCRGNWWG